MKYRLIGENNKKDIIENIFKNRNCSTKDIEVSEKDVCDYENLDNIQEGVQLLLKHLDNNSKIDIIVDCDVDGICSSAIMYSYIKSIYPNSDLNFVVHEYKKHGLSNDLKIRKNVDLIIIPDASSNDYKQHKFYKTNCIDILVLDHHEASRYSKNALIINNQLSNNYKNKQLSGAGVVYKFINAVNDYLFEEDEMVSKYLDLVAIGNIGDDMNMLSSETRYYCKLGLENIENNLLKAMIEENSYQLENRFNFTSVAFVIAPRLNAVTRAGTIEEKETVMKALVGIEDNYKDVAKLCNDIKKRQDSEVKKSIPILKKKVDLNKKYILLEVSSDLRQELTGLVANKLMDEYKRPTILYRTKDDEYVGGSTRGYQPMVEDLKILLQESNLFKFVEGHPNANGFEIKRKNLTLLEEYLDDKLKDKNIDIKDEYIYEVDNIFDSGDIDYFDALELCNYENEWGKGLSEPLFLFKNIEVDFDNVKLIGKKVKRLIFQNNGVEFTKAKTKKVVLEELENNGVSKINLIGRFRNNIYGNNIIPRVDIVDMDILSK